jgi:hypothetical protein
MPVRITRFDAPRQTRTACIACGSLTLRKFCRAVLSHGKNPDEESETPP